MTTMMRSGHNRAAAPTSVAAGSERDIGRFVGLIGIGAWLMFALFIVVFVSIAVIADGSGFPSIPHEAGLAIVIIGALLVASPSRTPLPRWRLYCVWVVVVAAVVLESLDLPTNAQPGFHAWELGACNFILFAVAVRGRAVGAWIGEALLIGTVLVWSQFATGAIWFGLSFSYGQPVSLVAGMAFAVGLHSVARQIFEYQDADRVRVADAAGRAEADEQRQRGLNQVRDLAEPILRAIAERRSPDRREVVGLEASLRDRIRARHLSLEPLTSTLRAMRESGTQILVLDDSEPLLPTEAQRARLARWCVDRLDESTASSITIRLAPVGDALVVSVVGDDGYTAELTI